MGFGSDPGLSIASWTLSAVVMETRKLAATQGQSGPAWGCPEVVEMSRARVLVTGQSGCVFAK